MKFSLRHQSSGKVYPYLEILAHLMLRGFFRKIHVNNRKGLPSDKPVLLAANHPTAFLDPMLLCPLLDPPLYNMTRGDMFQKPLPRMLMESVNMFPVFRLRDGYSRRGRNDEVFEFCEKQLVQNRVVTIYVEGEHHLEKHVRPIKKGIVWIAFGTYKNHDLDELQIIPAGCNYQWGDRPREEAMLNIGRPIFVKDYREAFEQDPKKAMNKMLAEIKVRLKEVCFHIDDLQDTPLVEQLLTLNRSEHPEPAIPIVVYNNKRFSREKEICDRVNTLDPELKVDLKKRSSVYFKSLEKAGLSDAALVNPAWGAWYKLLYFIAGFLPFLVGYITSYPLILSAKTIANKVVRKREFYSSVWIGAGFILGLLYYFLWIAGALISWNPWWIAFALSLPVLGWFSMFYRESWRSWLAARKAIGHSEQEQLLEARKLIVLP